MRRHLLSASLLAFSAVAVAQPRQLDFSNGADSIAMFRKIQCDTRDLTPAIYHWSGKVYSRVPGEPDRLLWRLEGMNVRQCVAVAADPARGAGFRMVSRELMFYLDPETGQIVDQWTNPWTGKSNDIFHVANDPVNQRPVYERGRDGKPYALDVRVENGRVFWNVEVPLFYSNPLGGDYQRYVGNQYHAMEIFDFVTDERELRSPRSTQANAAVAWVRISDWLPFMEMGDRAGGLVFNATGQKVPSFDALPQLIRDRVAARYPQYRTPPPGDDARPNATTWTEYKRLLDSRPATPRPPQ